MFRRSQSGGHYVYFVYGLLNKSVRIARLDCVTFSSKSDRELEGVWKEVIMATFRGTGIPASVW